MNLSKLAKTFSATSTADNLLVVGHATAAVNGVYALGEGVYSNGTCTIKAVSGKWGIYNGNALVTEEASATTRPQAGSWTGCSVLEAQALTVAADTSIVTISLVMTGGASGGLVALHGDGISQPYSVEAQTLMALDTKQVFGAGTVHVAGTPGTTAQLSYDVIS